MKYQRTVQLGGAWVKAADIKSGTKAKLVSETNPQPSQFLNKDGTPKMQDVAKLRIQGMTEPLNISLNRATINGLVEAFGEDSANWQNHVLSMETEKVRVAGKSVTALYLIAEGYERADDANGYAIIVKKGMQAVQETPPPQPVEEGEINVDDIPF